MNNDIKAIKSGIWYTISNFMLKSIGLITTPIFTRMLTKAEYGIYNNYASWLTIISIFVTLNLESTLISAKYDYEEDFDGYILSVLLLSSISSIIWFVIFSIFSEFIVEFTGVESVYLKAMLAYLFFYPAVQMFQARERYYFEYKKTVITSMLLTLGTAFLSVLLVLLMQNRLDGRILGAILPTILIGCCFYIYFIKEGKRIKIAYWKYAIPICIPYIPHLLAGGLLSSMDRVMINRWCGAEATAMYSLAYTCGTIVTMLISSINSAYAPWMGEKLSKCEYEEIKRISAKYISIFVVFAVGIMLFAPEFLWVLGGNEYYEARYVIAPVAMGCVCQFLYTMFVNIEQFTKKTMGMATATVIAACVNYILNFLLIPRYGYLAAAYTTLVGYLLLLITHMYLVWKIGLNNLYSYKYIACVVSGGIIFMLVITWCYNQLLIRSTLIFIYMITILVTLLKNKEMLMTLILRTRQP